jgi:hypothetical protein
MQNRHVLPGSILVLAMGAFAQDSAHTSVSAGVFSGSAHFSAAPLELHGQPAAGAPYSAEEISSMVQTLADGTHITRTGPTRKLCRDSAGRTRTERPLVGSVAGKQSVDVPVIVEITDPVEHVKYTLDTVNKVAHKQAMEARELQKIAAGTALCATPVRPFSSAVARAGAAAAPGRPSGDDAPQFSHEKLESRTMEGLLVEGARDTTVYPTGSQGNDRPITQVSESWRSPELKVMVLWTSNDPRNGENTQKLTNIDRSEPDPSLFVPPADYTVVEEKGDFTIKWGSEGQ